MSRLAKKPIVIPAEVTVEEKGGEWIFRGPKGELHMRPLQGVAVRHEGNAVHLSIAEGAAGKSKNIKAFLGTTASLFKSAVLGVAEGFEKKLEIEGVGYKVQPDGKNLIFSLGFSHPVPFFAPPGIAFAIEKNTIKVSGADRALVGRIAAEIRALKPPEPYKGKGIHYLGEVIRRKAGKKAVGAAS